MSKKDKDLDGQTKLKLKAYETLEQARSMMLEGSLYIQPQIKSLINQGLKRCPLSRYQVAAQMSELTGQEITKWMLDAWTAESKNGHRPPIEIIPAFCRVTGSYDLLRFLCEKCGCYMLEGEDILLTELGRLHRMEEELQDNLRLVSDRINEIRGGREIK